jgi:hypothetical protein
MRDIETIDSALRLVAALRQHFWFRSALVADSLIGMVAKLREFRAPHG